MSQYYPLMANIVSNLHGNRYRQDSQTIIRDPYCQRSRNNDYPFSVGFSSYKTAHRQKNETDPYEIGFVSNINWR